MSRAARVEECRSIASVARSRAARVAELHAQGISSRADLDQAGEAARQAEWQVRQAELEHRKIAVAAGNATEDAQLAARQQEQALAAADRKIEQLRARVATFDHTIAVATRNERMESVRAAMAGVVGGCDPRELGGRRVEAGEVVLPSSIPRPFASARSFRGGSGTRETGQEATIELAGQPRTMYRTFRGRVESIEREAQHTAPGAPGVYAERIALEQPWVATEHGRLYFPIGMRGTAHRLRPRLGIVEAIVEWVRTLTRVWLTSRQSSRKDLDGSRGLTLTRLEKPITQAIGWPCVRLPACHAGCRGLEPVGPTNRSLPAATWRLSRSLRPRAKTRAKASSQPRGVRISARMLLGKSDPRAH